MVLDVGALSVVPSSISFWIWCALPISVLFCFASFDFSLVHLFIR